MISISENIQLQTITLNDQQKLFELVGNVYPPVYKHLWKKKDCNWYLNTFYSFENLQKELKEADANYFFVQYNLKPVGIFRVHFSKTIKEIQDNSSAYLHRIYLGKEVHGKGIGRLLFNWAEQQARDKGKTSIWLKAMDTQEQALGFYRKQGYHEIGKLSLDFDLIHKPLRGMVIFKKSLRNLSEV
jgi:ribosomal protein S18 acetylase RimI-like enzyme